MKTKTKLPETISCASGEVTVAIANYLHNVHGVELDTNLIRCNEEPERDHFFAEGVVNVISINKDGSKVTAVWDRQIRSSGGFKTVREFSASLARKSWKVGCRTLVADGDGILIEEDNIRVPKSTIKEIYEAI